MEPFRYKFEQGIPYFTIDHWMDRFPHLVAGFTGKEAQDDWNERNYALHVGDRPEKVIENRRALSSLLNMPFSTWTCGNQVHGVHIEVVTQEKIGKGRDSLESAIPETDGLITLEDDVLLASFYADCVPLFFYSPDLDAVGVAHAGWKGTTGKIGSKMVAKFLEMGADPAQLQVAIGPSIGFCCYEVDKRVMEPLAQALGQEIPEHVAKPSKSERWQLDLKEANRELLIQAGVREENIVKSKYCTSCESERFYSHRRDQGKAGRMVAFIGKRRKGMQYE